jgi:hypothetical protein
MVLHTLSIHHPQEMLKTTLGLVPTVNPNDPVWLDQMASIATLIEIVLSYDTVLTLARCLGVLYHLHDIRRVLYDDLASRLTGATWYLFWLVGVYTEQHHSVVQAVQTIADLQG